MCQQEWCVFKFNGLSLILTAIHSLVNRHRGCGHNVLLYYSGEVYDCNQEYCGLSKAHIHKTARNCSCPKTYKDYIKVVNIIQEACDGCKEAAFAELVGRRR
ncbi:hypothetical protein BC629DRAFT_1292670 [Irpex lacteus]|nr:hypothetical protein BC629DRAFT_1292670 [Irpex lacteus]